jgi:hypothetical protein
MNPDLNVDDFPQLSRDLGLNQMDEYNSGATWNKFYWQVVELMQAGADYKEIVRELLSQNATRARLGEMCELMEYAEYSMY